MSEIDEIDETDGPAARPARAPHRVRTILLGLTACFLTLVLVVAGAGLYLEHKLTSQIGRIDNAFAGLGHRPAKPTAGDGAKAVNILLLSTRHDETVMVVHLDRDRRGASVISIPRDSWVSIPAHGAGTIGTALSLARPSLAVKTVESLTDLRIDHLAVIDWKVFGELTDSLGGIPLVVPRTVHDRARNITWTAGWHSLSGEEALDWSDQHFGLPGGELDRIRRQQFFLRRLMDGTLHQEFRKEPIQLYKVLDTVTSGLSVESEWSVGSMRGLVISLRNLRSADIGYITVPIKGTGVEGHRQVAYLDKGGDAELWNSVREDRVSEWLAAHPTEDVPAIVN